MGIVVYTKFNGEREQAQSFARGMSYQTLARNYAKESSNQHANREQSVFRIVCCCRPTSGSKKCATEILVSALYVSIILRALNFQ